MIYAQVVDPIMSKIGHDLARVTELSDHDLAVVFHVQNTANALLAALLHNVAGEGADELMREALALDHATRRARCVALQDAMRNDGKPDPRQLAAHVATSVLAAQALNAEAERRATGAAIN